MKPKYEADGLRVRKDGKLLFTSGVVKELEALQRKVADLESAALTGTVQPLVGNQVMDLARDMQFKLDKNKHKACSHMNPNSDGRTWEDCNFYWLVSRIEDEIAELIEEFEKGDLSEARLECADIANFAMMIHDNTGRLIASND